MNMKNGPGYPINVVRVIYGNTISGRKRFDSYTAPDDLLESVEYALNLLPGRYRDVIHLRFRDHMKYCDISKKFGYSNKWSNGVVKRAMRIMRHPYYIRLINEGIHNMNKEKSQTAHTLLSAVPIEDLSLSTRAYGSIKRAGINNVQELLDRISEIGLSNIRGIGKLSESEIMAELERSGYNK